VINPAIRSYRLATKSRSQSIHW